MIASVAAMASPNILIVGGGLTSAVTCRALCRALPAGSRVDVWEAMDALGGRFHTERTADGGACDTGAQYVTVTDDEAAAAANAPLFEELTSAGVLAPLRGRIEGGRAADGAGANYVAPAGLSSVVSHLFTSSGITPAVARRAVSLRCAASSDGGTVTWEARASDGYTQRYDGCLLYTSPSPRDS